MITATQIDIRGKTQELTDMRKKDMEDAYAKINEEIAAMLTSDERIIFGPAEDFEYTVPLEDFKRSRKIETR